MLASLRDGTWLTSERIRVYSLMLIVAYVLATLVWFGSAKGLLDWQDRPLGTDFAQVYAAGTFVREGHPEKPFDTPAHIQRQRAIFGAETAVFSWGYPPYFLAIAGILATLPYLAAFFVWQLTSLSAYLAMIRRIVPWREALLPALAFPAVYVNFGHGQTGFAAAALFGGALVVLDRRPILAGVLFALLAFKPQYGVLVPIALAASGRWMAFAAAAATLAAMTIAAWIGFGAETWTAFFDSLPASRHDGLEYSDTGFYKMQSLFAATRMLGGPVPLAYALHGALFAAVATSVAILWRGDADYRLKAAALATGAALATPYCFDYDMMILGPALAFMAAYGMSKGFLSWEKSLLAAAWAAPILTRGIAMTIFMPLGLLSMLVLFGLVLRRAIADGAVSLRWVRRVSPV